MKYVRMTKCYKKIYKNIFVYLFSIHEYVYHAMNKYT